MRRCISCLVGIFFDAKTWNFTLLNFYHPHLFFFYPRAVSACTIGRTAKLMFRGIMMMLDWNLYDGQMIAAVLISWTCPLPGRNKFHSFVQPQLSKFGRGNEC